MAKRIKFLNKVEVVPGALSLFFISFILLFTVGGFMSSIPLMSFFTDFSLHITPYIKKVILFSFYQAFLSTLCSLIPAYFIAKSLYRREFIGKTLILGICSTTLILPSLVVVLGLIFLYGKAGILISWVNSILGGSFTFSIYGLHGILLAHVFFNLPYATLLFLKAFNSISSHQLKLAAQLNFTQKNLFKLIEWPIIKKQAVYLSAIIFTLCFSSFSIVLLLGGGPKATTIELSIYQAITYEYDFQKAAILSIIQLLFCSVLLVLSQSLATHFSSPSETINWKLKSKSCFLKYFDILLILLLILLIIPPIMAIFIAGINRDFWHTVISSTTQSALFNSLIIGFISASLSLFLAISLSWTARSFVLKKKQLFAKFLIVISSLPLMIPGIVLASGVYISLFYLSLTDTKLANPYLIIPIINAFMALPFVLNQVYHSMLNSAKTYEKLCQIYAIRGINRLWMIDIKGNKNVFKKAFAFAMTLSIGDIGVISILGSQHSGDAFLTLPYLLFLKLGNYQSGSADAIALILLVVVLSIFLVCETKNTNTLSNQ